MIKVEIPHKNAIAEFPDGTPPEIIQAAIKKQFYSPSMMDSVKQGASDVIDTISPYLKRDVPPQESQSRPIPPQESASMNVISDIPKIYSRLAMGVGSFLNPSPGLLGIYEGAKQYTKDVSSGIGTMAGGGAKWEDVPSIDKTLQAANRGVSEGKKAEQQAAEMMGKVLPLDEPKTVIGKTVEGGINKLLEVAFKEPAEYWASKVNPEKHPNLAATISTFMQVAPLALPFLRKVGKEAKMLRVVNDITEKTNKVIDITPEETQALKTEIEGLKTEVSKPVEGVSSPEIPPKPYHEPIPFEGQPIEITNELTEKPTVNLYHYTENEIKGDTLKAGNPHEQNYFGDGVYLTEKGQFPGKFEYQVELPKDIKILDLTSDKAYTNFRNKISKEIGIPLYRSGQSLYDDLRYTAAYSVNEVATNIDIRKAVAKISKKYDAIKAPYFGTTPKNNSFELVIKNKDVLKKEMKARENADKSVIGRTVDIAQAEAEKARANGEALKLEDGEEIDRLVETDLSRLPEAKPELQAGEGKPKEAWEMTRNEFYSSLNFKKGLFNPEEGETWLKYKAGYDPITQDIPLVGTWKTQTTLKDVFEEIQYPSEFKDIPVDIIIKKGGRQFAQTKVNTKSGKVVKIEVEDNNVENAKESFLHEIEHLKNIKEEGLPTQYHDIIDIRLFEKGMKKYKEDVFEKRAFSIGHREKVIQALSEGKHVPAEVLKDYPDLQKSHPPSVEGVEGLSEKASPLDNPLKSDKGGASGETTEMYAGLPIKQATDKAMPIYRDMQKIFTPASIGSESKITAGIIREKSAELAQKKEVLFKNLEGVKNEFDKMNVQSQLDYIDNIETGKSQKTIPENIISKSLQKVLSDRWKIIQKMKGTDSFIENYFPHIWEDFTKASQIFNKKPLEGSKSFLKKRTIPTIKEGIELGLKPLTTNPAELTMLKAYEMDRYIMGQEVFGEMKDTGLAKFVRFGKKPPEGYTKINDKIARVLQYSEKEKGMILRGEYYAPEQAARILNNYLSPGLKGNPLYDVMRGAGNLLNQVQLGLSAFHLTFTTIDSVVSKFGLGIQELARGQYKRGLKDISPHQLVTAPITNYIRGNKLLEAYYKNNPEMKNIIDGLIKGGGRVKMDSFYKNSSVESFWKALNEGDYGKAGLESIPAIIESLAKPIMEHIVPRQKLGVMMDMVESQLDYWKKNGHTPTIVEMRETFGKQWDSVDNRMGQLVYDNLFWNKTLKDLGLISTRSLGWNLGTVRELGGGIKDIKDIKQIEGGIHISPRTAYVAALPVVVGLYGAMLTYLYTGKSPEDLKSYYFIKTGRKLPDGRDERMVLPSYIKDVVAYSKHPLTVIGHKVHPLISSIIDMLKNEDFYGVEIRNKDDSYVKQLQDEFNFALKQFVPFSIRGMEQRKKAGGSIKEQAESFIGIMPAPKYVTQTKAENLIDEYSLRHFSNVKSKEEFEKIGEKQDIKQAINSKNPEIINIIKESGLQPAEIINIIRNSQKNPLIMKTMILTPKEAIDIWDAADTKERNIIKLPIILKIMRSKTISSNTKREYLLKLRNAEKESN